MFGLIMLPESSEGLVPLGEDGWLEGVLVLETWETNVFCEFADCIGRCMMVSLPTLAT